MPRGQLQAGVDGRLLLSTFLTCHSHPPHAGRRGAGLGCLQEGLLHSLPGRHAPGAVQGHPSGGRGAAAVGTLLVVVKVTWGSAGSGAVRSHPHRTCAPTKHTSFHCCETERAAANQVQADDDRAMAPTPPLSPHSHPYIRSCEMEQAAADQMEADYDRAYAEFSRKHAESAPLVAQLKQVGGAASAMLIDRSSWVWVGAAAAGKAAGVCCTGAGRAYTIFGQQKWPARVVMGLVQLPTHLDPGPSQPLQTQHEKAALSSADVFLFPHTLALCPHPNPPSTAADPGREGGAVGKAGVAQGDGGAGEGVARHSLAAIGCMFDAPHLLRREACPALITVSSPPHLPTPCRACSWKTSIRSGRTGRRASARRSTW